MKRLLLTASISAMMLAACSPATDAPATEPAAVETAETGEETATVQSEALPVDLGNPVFEETTEDYSVRVVVDSRIAAFQPVLAEDLMTAGKGRLEEIKRDAVADGQNARERAEAGEETWFRPYSMDIRFTQTAQAGDVIGIEQFVAVDTGGAHPNYVITGLVHERSDEYPLMFESVVSDPAGFGTLLKAGLIAEKSNRAYDDELRAGVPAEVEELLGDGKNAAEKFGKNFTLVPSTEAGKFGGIAVLFSPYEVGPYAEGSYEIIIPAADLAGKLRPDWAPRFGGEPVLPEEPTSQE